MLERAIRESVAQPGDIAALIFRADLTSLAGHGEDAAILVESMLSHRSESPRREVLAALYRARAAAPDADAIAGVLSLAVTDVELLVAQAEIAWRASEGKVAQEKLSRVLAADPSHRRAHGLRGMMGRTGSRARLLDLEAGIDGDRTIPGLLIALGDSRRDAGNVEAASDAYEGALGRPADRIVAVESLAALYVRTKRLKTGRRRLRDLLEATPQTAATRQLRGHLAYWLGILHQPSKGRYASAKYLKQARILLGEEARILYHLAVYFDARGYRKVATKLFAQAEVIDPAFRVKTRHTAVKKS